jgi:hypothetical protein
MNIRKEVYERIVNTLFDEKNKVNRKINANKYTIKRLSEEQTILKAERKKIYNMIRELK